MIEFPCPHCDRPRSARNDQAGLMVRCPDCGEELSIPAMSPRRRIKPRRVIGPGNPAKVWGVILAVLGAVLVFYFGAIFDTTVPTGDLMFDYDTRQWHKARVYNVGRMQDRWVGLLIGFACVAGGAGLLIWQAMRRVKPQGRR